MLLTATALAGCADVSKLPPEQRGKAAYATYQCGRCHRVGAEGGDTGPDLTFVGARKGAEFLDVWLKDPSAWQPDTTMPNFSLADDSRKALAAYLATLKGQAYRGEAGAPWDRPELRKDPVRRGEAIYNRAGCVTCHGRAGRGGYRINNVAGGKIPPLDSAFGSFSKEELLQRVAKGATPLPADPAARPPMLAMPAWGGILTKDELSDVADYLLTLRPPGGLEEW